MSHIDSKLTKRPTGIGVGDHIRRSEYNDGILRNNHRVDNRLSKEMQMFDKAQRVIMKDLSKDAQLLRAKLNTSSITTPRLGLMKNNNFRHEPFAVYGQNAVGSKRNSPRKPRTVSHSAGGFELPSPAPGYNTPRGGITPRSGMLEPMNIRSDKSFMNFQSNTQGEVANEKTGKRKLKSKTASKTDGETSGIDQPSSSRLTSSRLLTHNGKLEPKGGRSSVLSGTHTRLSVTDSRLSNSPVPGSRLSFIDILAEAEERKAREAAKKEAQKKDE